MCAYPLIFSTSLMLTEPGMSSFRLSPTMSKYSLLFEADSYKEIGPFRFAIYNDFTPGETRAFNKLNKSFAGSTYKSMQLARKIATDHGIKPDEALKIISSITAQENQSYLFEYAEDIEELADGVISEEERQAQLVTMFMQFRGELRDGEGAWERTPDWSDADTDHIPGGLITQIYELMMSERNGKPQGAEGNDETSVQATPTRRVPMKARRDSSD